MLFVHILPSQHWVDDDAFAAITETAEAAVTEIRQHLPTLATDLYLLINQTPQVTETGDGGFAVGPQCIRWDVDPNRGVAVVARSRLRHTLFHECHHAVRLQQRPHEAQLIDWPTVAVFEGLATVFAHAVGGDNAPWRQYDDATIEAWATELWAQPIGDDAHHWRFEHPDGRRNIVYRVGCWLVDRAIAASGRTAADLVWAPPEEIRTLATR